MRNGALALLFLCVLVAGASSQQSSSAQSKSTSPAKSASAGAQTAGTPAKDAGPGPAAHPAANPAATPKPDDKGHDYSKESFVVEKMHGISYRFEWDGTRPPELIARIRVQSEAGVQQWGQLQVGYNSANERVEIPYVRVVKEDGTVVKAGDDAVQDLSAPECDSWLIRGGNPIAEPATDRQDDIGFPCHCIAGK